MAQQIEKVGVLGAGLMGHGIAQVAAESGYDVVVREVDEAALQKGIGKIEKQLARAVEKGKATQQDADAVRGRIEGTVHYHDLAGCDLVIEAITESLPLKLEMWREIDEIVKPEAVFATNTSSLAVIDQAAVTGRPQQFVGLHYFNPAQVMKLVEVVRCVTTGRGGVRRRRSSSSALRASSASPPRTRRVSSSTGCWCRTCSTRSAPTKRESARWMRSTTR